MARVTRYVKPVVLNVFMSNKYVYAAVLHAPTGTRLAQASSSEQALKEGLPSTSDKGAAAKVGQALAERMLEKQISAVCHELKPGERYHGKLKTLLDSLRAGGVSLV